MIWTIERNRTLVEMMASGLSVDEMATRLGCTPENIKHKIYILETYGPVVDEKISYLWRSGWSFRKIEKEVGIDKTTVRNLLLRIGELDDPANAHLRGLRHKVRWDDQLDAQLRDLHANGHSIRSIAREMGLCQTTVKARMEKLGLKPNPRRPKKKWSEESEAILKQKILEGLSYDEIAAIFGVSRGTIIGKAHRLGLRYAYKNCRIFKIEEERQAERREREGRKIIRLSRNPFKSLHPDAKIVNTLCDDDATGAVYFTELSSGQCRWPVRGSGVTMLCCAHQVDGKSPYCSKHRKRAIRPLPIRRRRAKRAVERVMQGAWA